MKKSTLLTAFFVLLMCGRPDVIIEEMHEFTIVGVCSLPGYGQDIQIVDHIAYVADGQGGLQIVNIADPESTFIMSEYITPRSAEAIAVRDTLAFVGVASDNGLFVIGITDPTNCTFVAQDPQGSQHCIAAPPDDSLYVYIAAHDFFIIEDCSNPSFPYAIEMKATPGNARGVFVLNSRAYVVCEQMGLYIYDITRPDSAVTLLGSIDTPSNARNVFVRDDYAYIADGRTGLVIVDVSTPETPVMVSTCDTPEYAQDIYIHGTNAYVADHEGGLQVIDVSDPLQPMFYGEMETPYAQGVYVANDLVYIADRDWGVVIIAEEVQ